MSKIRKEVADMALSYDERIQIEMNRIKELKRKQKLEKARIRGGVNVLKKNTKCYISYPKANDSRRSTQ